MNQYSIFIVKASGHRFKQVAFFIALCAVVALLGGIACNAFENWNLNRLHPVPGKIYTVGAYPMHIYCIGQGSPTVVLESGLGNDWLIWQKVQPEIATTNRVCSYDRAGLGWSAARPGSRGAPAIAEQLEGLLAQAGIHDKLVLVGHSAGGLYVRAFAGLFPNRVAGLIFVDASSPEAFHALPSPAVRRQLIAQRHREAPWLLFKVATGLARLSGDYCNPNTSQRIPAVQDLARAEDCRPAYMNSWLGEWDDFESSAERVFKMPCCDSIPLVIISEDPGPPRRRDANVSKNQQTWDTVQEGLKRLSSRSTRIIARNSRHYVMVDRPDVVVAGIDIVDAELHGRSERIQPGQTIWR
jgi:pimeloyl-ACP methyl ester carboxylesterase